MVGNSGRMIVHLIRYFITVGDTLNQNRRQKLRKHGEYEIHTNTPQTFPDRRMLRICQGDRVSQGAG